MDHPAVLKTLSPAEFTEHQFGLPAVQDIFAELEKPGRDPRPEFKAATGKGHTVYYGSAAQHDSRRHVTSVVAFDAFVDVGVHQDRPPARCFGNG
jgi:uncharacterized protein